MGSCARSFTVAKKISCILRQPFVTRSLNIVMFAIAQENPGNNKQFGRMPVLEEARTIDYVTNHNVLTIDHHGDEHFQNIKNGGRTRGNIGVKYSLLFRFHFDFSMPNYRKR